MCVFLGKYTLLVEKIQVFICCVLASEYIYIYIYSCVCMCVAWFSVVSQYSMVYFYLYPHVPAIMWKSSWHRRIHKGNINYLSCVEIMCRIGHDSFIKTCKVGVCYSYMLREYDLQLDVWLTGYIQYDGMWSCIDTIFFDTVWLSIIKTVRFY